MFEYIDYTEPGENDYSRFWMRLVISPFYSVGLYYTYGVAPPLFNLRRVPWSIYLYLGGTFVSGRLLTPQVCLLQAPLINETLSIASLWRGCNNTLVSSTSRFSLKCHGTEARLSPRAMAPFAMMSLGLTNTQDSVQQA